MNVAAPIDARDAKFEPSPEGELAKDWEDPDVDAEVSRPAAPPARRGWFSLNRSPLARKIITFNLMALVVLVAGVLYFNPVRDSLVQQRVQGLVAEARLVTNVLETAMPSTGPVVLAANDGINAEDVLRTLELTRGAEVLVFDTQGTLIASQAATSAAPEGLEDGGSTVITDFLNRIWETISNHDNTVSIEQLARPFLDRALNGETVVETGDSKAGTAFVVATPLRQNDMTVGAVVLGTVGGSIDKLIRLEREQILQMFVIAILVSIGLSLVLASTIANPLSELAAAAEAGRDTNSRKLSPSRARIPDMTGRPDEIGRLSGAFRGMVSALYDRIESNEQFAADVSHEIKNPLSSLRSAVDTLRVAKNDVQRGKLLDVIEHDVRRLDRLVTDISNASRLDSELVKEEMENFDLVKSVTDIMEYHRADAESAGIDFIADLPAEPIRIDGLEARLAQVFVNLITNALSFCEEGDAVRVWARQREDRVLVVVEDTGPGVPDNALTKIFNRFYSERPANDFGNNSGLGLSISKQIVEAHGGVIWAENIRPTDVDPTSEPLGARFVVGLPV